MGFCTFYINIKVTENLSDNVDKVIKQIYLFIYLLKSINSDPLKYKIIGIKVSPIFNNTRLKYSKESETQSVYIIEILRQVNNTIYKS